MTMHVLPTEMRPARLAALPKLPIFMELTGKRVAVVGGSDAAAWKAELLAAAGAHVCVYASEPCAELTSLLESGNAIALVRRGWRDADLRDVWIVIAENAGADEAARLSAAARSQGALVNVIDQPDLCDFQFGTIVNRAPAVVGISTDGAAPVLGQAIRRRIEAVLPASLGAWTAAAKAFRGRLKEVLPSRGDRRAFWERFVDVTFISQSEEDATLERLERLAQEIRLQGAPRAGEVVIVGAGPGDPELLTLKAVRELQAADVIVYDRLVTAGVLELGRREARRILAGKKGHGAACQQDDICGLLVQLARDGNRVVRLKGGDPAIFGRTAEEVAACRAAGLPVRIVPGITSASAAAAAAGISLTHRRHAQRVQFVTGHDRHGGLPSGLDVEALVDRHATTVVYMGGRTIGALAERMLSRGLAPDTPAMVIRSAARADETRQRVKLIDLAGSGLPDTDAPTLVIIGSVVDPDSAGAAGEGHVGAEAGGAHARPALLHPPLSRSSAG